MTGAGTNSFFLVYLTIKSEVAGQIEACSQMQKKKQVICGRTL